MDTDLSFGIQIDCSQDLNSKSHGWEAKPLPLEPVAPTKFHIISNEKLLCNSQIFHNAVEACGYLRCNEKGRSRLGDT